ncbi:MAG TPA: MFS transporter [Methanocorpusculum sp.]|nr:MFS transporter [Methanocorpusculum sp.]
MYTIVTDRRPQILLIILAAAAFFLDGLSTAIVNNVLPVITQQFDISIAYSSWITQTYFLAFVGFILPFGKIADNGRLREVMIGGLGLFALGLIVCAIAPSFPLMIVARFVQGLGAAMIGGACPVIITRLLPSSKHGVGIGFAATLAGVAIIVGPALGGFITELSSWHWAFLVSVPFAIAGIFMALRLIPKAEKTKTRFDVLGTALVFLIVASFVIALNSFPTFGITHPLVLISAAVFVVTLIWYIFHSLHFENPLLHVDIFRTGKFTAVAISYMLLCGIYAGVLYIVPYFMQIGLCLDSATSGILLAVPAIIAAVIATPVGFWADKRGTKLPCILSSVSYTIFCALFAVINPAIGLAAFIVGLVFMGLAFGLMGGPATARIIQCAPEDKKSEGATIMMLFNYLGCVVGLAVYNAAFALGVPASSTTVAGDMALDLFLPGFHATAIAGLIFAIISLVLTIIVPKMRPENPGKK